MDLICPICAEPWDVDSLHDTADPDLSFDDASAAFRRHGCEVFGQKHGATTEHGATGNAPVLDGVADKAAAAAEIYDLLGDDVDGAAALLEDFGIS